MTSFPRTTHMKKIFYFSLAVITYLAVPSIVQGQESVAPKIPKNDPLEDIILLSKKMAIYTDLAAKLRSSDPQRAAELLPNWEIQLNAATAVEQALAEMVDKISSNVDMQKKQIAKLPVDQRETYRKFLTKLEEELDMTINRHSILAEATTSLKKQLAATKADDLVGAFLKNKETQSKIDDKLKELNDAIQRLQGSANK